MRFLLDANACILLLAGDPLVVARAADCASGEIGLSAIAYAEVALGSNRGKPPSTEGLERLTRVIPVLPFDHAAADRYALLAFRRRSFDRLIAAHALSLGLTLITNNETDFSDVVGLSVENWTL